MVKESSPSIVRARSPKRWALCSQAQRLAPVAAVWIAAAVSSACGSPSSTTVEEVPVTAAATTEGETGMTDDAARATAAEALALAATAAAASVAPLPATPPAYRPTPSLGSDPFVASVAKSAAAAAARGAPAARSLSLPLDVLDTVPPVGTVGAPVVVVVPGALPGPAQAMGLRPVTAAASR